MNKAFLGLVCGDNQQDMILANSIKEKNIEFLLYGVVTCLKNNNLVDADEYLKNPQRMKRPLAIEVTSKKLDETVHTLAIHFQDIRSRVRELQDMMTTLLLAYRTIWSSMLEEKSTKSFYEMVCYTYMDVNVNI